MVLALGSPLPGPPWGHMYHMNDFESPAPKDDSWHVWLKSDQAFSRSRWNSYFLHRAPSPTCYPPHHKGPLGPPWELPWTICILHLRRSIVYTHYITWLFYLTGTGEAVWNLHGFSPWGPPPGPHEGHMYHMNNFESPAPRDDSCQVWLKSDHALSRRRWNSYFLQRAPSPTCYPPQGPIGATPGTVMNNFYSSPNKVSTHYIILLFSFWIWRRRYLKFAWFWPFGALPLGPHGGHTYNLNNFESPTPKDDSCQVWLKSNHVFSRRRWKCKKFTHDARKRTAIAHLSQVS